MLLSYVLLGLGLLITVVYGFIPKVNLGDSTNFFWGVNYDAMTIAVEIHTKVKPNSSEWIGVGFSNYGEIMPSDMCFFWLDWKRLGHLQDTWIDKKGYVHIDKQQDCGRFVYTLNGTKTVFSFTRNIDTCEGERNSHEDYIIEEGTTHIVYAKGTGPLYRLKGLNVNSAYETGFSRVTILYTDLPSPPHPKDTWKFEIIAHRLQIPAQETTYWCKVMKLPDALRKKHHIIRYEPVFEPKSEHLVHHMEVFQCVADVNSKISLYEGFCEDAARPPDTNVCSKVLSAWAMGAPPFVYPKEAGLAIGGPDHNKYIMLQVHYHNPHIEKGVFDNSGFRWYLTPTLRPYDAAIMELGLEYNNKMAIPPRIEAFSLSGYCISGCTAVGLPKEGITVFASQLHTHLTGVKVYTKHVRGGKELPELNRDNHYSQHLQEIRILKKPVHVLPDDALITTCVYNTKDRTNATLTGFSISEEMCVNYIFYYPKTALEVCKSSITDTDLNNYFEHLARWEGQNTGGDGGFSEKYSAIEWNPIRTLQLKNFYDISPLSMQCNQSTGERFPGNWEGLPKDRILVPLEKPMRTCRKTNRLQKELRFY